MQAYELSTSMLDTLYVGEYEAPLATLNDLEEPPYAVSLEGREYVYQRSVPVKGHGAILPPLLDEWVGEEGRDVLIAQRGDRYYVYLTPASAAAAAGA